MTDEYRFGPCMVCNKPARANPRQTLCCSERCRDKVQSKIQWLHDTVGRPTEPLPNAELESLATLTREHWLEMLEAKRKRSPGPRKHVSYHHINQVCYAPEDVVVTWDGVPLEDVTTEPEPDNG